MNHPEQKRELPIETELNILRTFAREVALGAYRPEELREKAKAALTGAAAQCNTAANEQRTGPFKTHGEWLGYRKAHGQCGCTNCWQRYSAFHKLN